MAASWRTLFCYSVVLGSYWSLGSLIDEGEALKHDTDHVGSAFNDCSRLNRVILFRLDCPPSVALLFISLADQPMSNGCRN